MGCQILLHEAIGFLVLERIPLNVFMLYFVLANEKSTDKFVTFVLEIFDTGKYVPHEDIFVAMARKEFEYILTYILYIYYAPYEPLYSFNTLI